MSESEFRDAYALHKDVLYRFARRMTGSASVAEDLVQDCFLMFWRGGAVYRPERGSLRSFLLGVMRNLAIKRFRGSRVFEELEEETALCAPVDPSGRERGELVEQAVRALPPLQREVLILAEYEEMKLEEIAQATGAELAAVKSRLHRARTNLRSMLASLLDTKGAACGTR
jgi:RNA polymerase sigma-70 factor (ECF subfamily)